MRITKYQTMLNEDKLPYLVKEKSTNYNSEEFNKITMPKFAVKMLNDVFNLSRLTEEYVYELCLDTRGGIIGVFELSHGTISCSACNNREIIMKALLCNASGIIIVHNHPSGDVTPSDTDIAIHSQIKEGCKLMGVNFLDFIIVGDNTYFSFNE